MEKINISNTGSNYVHNYYVHNNNVYFDLIDYEYSDKSRDEKHQFYGKLNEVTELIENQKKFGIKRIKTKLEKFGFLFVPTFYIKDIYYFGLFKNKIVKTTITDLGYNPENRFALGYKIKTEFI